jgi:hypothetical protein
MRPPCQKDAEPIIAIFALKRPIIAATHLEGGFWDKWIHFATGKYWAEACPTEH